MISALDHVDHLAELDALAFVETFGRSFDESDGALAWLEEAWPRAAEDAALDESEADGLSSFYRRRLAAETRRLTGERDAGQR